MYSGKQSSVSQLYVFSSNSSPFCISFFLPKVVSFFISLLSEFRDPPLVISILCLHQFSRPKIDRDTSRVWLSVFQRVFTCVSFSKWDFSISCFTVLGRINKYWMSHICIGELSNIKYYVEDRVRNGFIFCFPDMYCVSWKCIERFSRIPLSKKMSLLTPIPSSKRPIKSFWKQERKASWKNNCKNP